MKPVEVDVIAPLPEGWGLCVTCEMMMSRASLDKNPYERAFEVYPPEWRQDFENLSAFIFELSPTYGDSILIRIFDPRSPSGLWKSIRHWVRKYPAFIINGRQKFCGLDQTYLIPALQAAGAIPQNHQHS